MAVQWVALMRDEQVIPRNNVLYAIEKGKYNLSHKIVTII